MSLSVIGAAAAFLSIVQSGGTYSLVLTADASTLTAGDYSGSIRETSAGYSNSPLDTPFTITVQGASDPIFRTIIPVADRTFRLVRVPSPATAGTSAYAAFAAQAFDPSDRSPWYVDLSTFFTTDEAFDSIVSLSPSAAAAALSIQVDDGARRVAVDRTNKLIEFRLKCLASNLRPFSGEGAKVGIDIKIKTSGAFVDQYHKTLGINARIS